MNHCEASALREPASDELRRWFVQNAQHFATPSLVTFRHLYFSPDLRGAHPVPLENGNVRFGTRTIWCSDTGLGKLAGYGVVTYTQGGRKASLARAFVLWRCRDVWGTC